MGRPLTEDEVRERMGKNGFTLVGEFTKMADPHYVVCPICNEPWRTTLGPILKAKSIKGCKSCGIKRGKSQRRVPQEQVDKELAKYDLKMSVPYTHAHQKAEVECLICGWKWRAKMLHARAGRSGCEICTDRPRTPEAWEYLMREHNIIIPDHSLYGAAEGCPVQCTVCGYTWTPNNLTDVKNGSSRCAACSGHFWPLDRINKEVGKPKNIRAIRRTEGKRAYIDWLCLNDDCGHKWSAHLGNVKKRTSCPECAEYGFKKSKPSEFYYARINHPSGKPLYMIGITNNTFEFRYSADDLSKMVLIERIPYDYEGGGADAFKKESALKRKFKHVLYGGKSPIESKSRGDEAKSMEIFTEDILGLDKDAGI